MCFFFSFDCLTTIIIRRRKKKTAKDKKRRECIRDERHVLFAFLSCLSILSVSLRASSDDRLTSSSSSKSVISCWVTHYCVIVLFFNEVAGCYSHRSTRQVYIHINIFFSSQRRQLISAFSHCSSMSKEEGKKSKEEAWFENFNRKKKKRKSDERFSLNVNWLSRTD